MRPPRGVDERADGPLSFGQERLWLSALLQPRSPVYNVPVVLRLRGELDVAALEQAMAAIVQRHEALRARFAVVDAEPRQWTAPMAPIGLVVTELSHVPDAGRWDRALALVTEESERPFDLRRGPLFRVSLIALGPGDHLFVFVVHHIAFDGWSRDIFLDQLATFYEGFRAGRSPAPAEPRPTYAGYAAWQREAMRSAAAGAGLAFWRDLLADTPETLELATDRPRPRARSFAGDTLVDHVGAHVVSQLRETATRTSTTLYVTLLAAFTALLHRHTGQDDIVLGSPFAGRTRSIDQETIGFFVNTLPVRARITGIPPSRTWCATCTPSSWVGSRTRTFRWRS